MSDGTIVLDKSFIALLGLGFTFLLALIGFLFKVWDTKQANKTAESNSKAITEALRALEPHIERGRETHTMVSILKTIHEVHDEDGRLLCHNPKEVIDTNRAIAVAMQTMAELMTRIEEKVEAHRRECSNKFHQIEKDLWQGQKQA